MSNRQLVPSQLVHSTGRVAQVTRSSSPSFIFSEKMVEAILTTADAVVAGTVAKDDDSRPRKLPALALADQDGCLVDAGWVQVSEALVARRSVARKSQPRAVPKRIHTQAPVCDRNRRRNPAT